MLSLLIILLMHFPGLLHARVPLPLPKVYSAQVQQPDNFLATAGRFLSAKEKSLQLSATKEDIEAVLNFCSDTVKYDHRLSPDTKFSFTGKQQWRAGSISHLGETRNAKLQITKSITRQNVVIIEFTLYWEFKSDHGWQKSTRTNVSVIEFNKDGKISKLTDYL